MAAPDLNDLQQRIGYVFRQPALLEQALTHSSLLQQADDVQQSNQRLEFLGDAVLQLILTENLFHLHPGEREGPLSKQRAALSKGPFLANLALELGLPVHLRVAESEERSGGRERPAALEDAFEALVGAIYLDSDYGTSRDVVLAWYGSIEARLARVEPAENPKGRLQELIQPAHGNSALQYTCNHVAGEDHAREYEARVFLKDTLLGIGRGRSKKTAEEAAAREALRTLQKD